MIAINIHFGYMMYISQKSYRETWFDRAEQEREHIMTKLELEKIAVEVRKGIITGVHSAKSGHPGGSLSAAEIFTYLYFVEMNVDPKNPKDPNRDRFVLSKGHVAPGLYATLAQKGYFPVEELKGLRHIGGDGEIQEGQIWEASMFAGARKLDNLVLFVDNNGLQIDGNIEDVCSPYPIDKKFEAFNFHVININGNDFDEIAAALKEARETKGQPTAIIAKTIKGKGVSYMENQAGWHGKAPNDEEFAIAMEELKKAGEALCQK